MEEISLLHSLSKPQASCDLGPHTRLAGVRLNHKVLQAFLRNLCDLRSFGPEISLMKLFDGVGNIEGDLHLRLMARLAADDGFTRVFDDLLMFPMNLMISSMHDSALFLQFARASSSSFTAITTCEAISKRSSAHWLGSLTLPCAQTAAAWPISLRALGRTSPTVNKSAVHFNVRFWEHWLTVLAILRLAMTMSSIAVMTPSKHEASAEAHVARAKIMKNLNASMLQYFIYTR